VTALTFDNYAQDGVLDRESAIQFCCNQSDDEEAAYLGAIEFTAGCLIYPKCFLQQIIADLLVPDATVSEGQFLTNTVNALCKAEQSGEKFCFLGVTGAGAEPCSVGGCDTEAPICPFDTCGGDGPQRN